MVLAVLVDELLVVGDDGLGNSLADGVDLGSVTTSSDPDTDIDTSEVLGTDDEEGLVGLEAEDVRLHEVDRLAIDLEKALAGLAVGNGGGCRILQSATCSRVQLPSPRPTLFPQFSQHKILLRCFFRASRCRGL